MIALLLSLAIFAYFTLVGRALQWVLTPSTRLIQGWLLSPVLGFSVTLLLVTILNQAGCPVGKIGPGVLVFTSGISLWIFWRRKPARPRSLLWLYALCAAAAMLACGWPMLLYGFNWLSFGNADMAYYCISADRMLRSGFFEIPDAQGLSGYDWPQTLWIYVPMRARFGSEMLVAWVSSVTHFSPFKIFMPTTLALLGMQASTAMGLVASVPRRHAAGLLTGLLLMFSPLFQFGYFYQLNSQIGGLALLFAACALSHRAVYLRKGGRGIIGHAIFMGVILCAMVVFYPEVAPFLVLVSFGLLAWGFIKFPAQRMRYLKFIVLLVAVVVLLTRSNLLFGLIAISVQSNSGFSNTDIAATLFPYFMVPSGIANLFGFLAIPNLPSTWLLNAMIVGGLILLVLCTIVALKKARFGEPWAFLLLTMLVVGIRLFKGDSDFGLFKLAMFAQPVLMAALACLAVSAFRARAWIAALVFCGVAVPACWDYASVSRGLRSGSFAELPLASKFGTDLPPTFKPGDRIFSDITRNTAVTIAGVQLRGTHSVFLSKPFFPTRAILFEGPFQTLDRKLYPEIYAQNENVERELKQHWRKTKVFGATFGRPITQPGSTASPGDWFLRLNNQFNLLNRSRPYSDGTRYFLLEPLSQLENYLVFIDSSKGYHYFLGDQQRISYFAQEHDFYFPSRDFFGLGRFLLFQVVRPSEEFYLKISLSRGVMGSGRTQLPTGAAILGDTTQPLPLVGAGAATVVVGPIRPKMLDGSAYIALDFGQEGTVFPKPKHGLMTLFNPDVSLDHRRLVAFGRDISIFTKAELDDLPRPRQLTQFPADLLGSPGIEFSGIYEDGWISQNAYVVLAKAQANDHLRIKGSVPGIDGMAKHTPELTVLVNKVASGTYPITPGEFDLTIPLPHPDASEPQTRIDLVFSQAGNLLPPDDRPVSAKLDILGLFPQ